MAREVGGAKLRDCVVLPALDTRGGAAIFWDPDVVEINSHAIGQFAITAQVRLKASGKSFWLTTVYGPTDDERKEDFLTEIRSSAPKLDNLG